LSAQQQVASMTGFARADGRDHGYAWTFEIKSVNGRNLDLRCRVAPGFDALEPVARAAVPQRIRRGNVNVTLTVTRSVSGGELRINRSKPSRKPKSARRASMSSRPWPPP
jgi:uncharacterized protein (TIGR00255 family)